MYPAPHSVYRQEEHLKQCESRRKYMAEHNSKELAAEKRACRYFPQHKVLKKELELHELQCQHEYERKMMNKENGSWTSQLVHDSDVRPKTGEPIWPYLIDYNYNRTLRGLCGYVHNFCWCSEKAEEALEHVEEGEGSAVGHVKPTSAEPKMKPKHKDDDDDEAGSDWYDASSLMIFQFELWDVNHVDTYLRCNTLNR